MLPAAEHALPRRRVLVLVLAFEAERTLAAVLDRFPPELDADVLVLDDASPDRSFEAACRWKAAHPAARVEVRRNERNLGYGGNQKRGYAYAIAEGYGVVAMVHGDGQYAPEDLPRLLAPLLAGEADAVFGSRMLARGDALRGGMPLYKFVGNRVLTRLQNRLAGVRLSEFHSGFRLYAVEALRGLRLELDSDGFSFDSEIILQLLAAKRRILEMPIATRYGDEVSHVDGLAYAREVSLASLAYALHRRGWRRDPRFEV